MDDVVTDGSWLSIADAVEKLNVSRKTIYKYLNSEKLISKKENGRRFVWFDDTVKVSPGYIGDKGNKVGDKLTHQSLLIEKYKMRVDMLETKLGVREEQVASFKEEIHRLSVLLMLEKRSLFARFKDFLIGSTFLPNLEIK